MKAGPRWLRQEIVQVETHTRVDTHECIRPTNKERENVLILFASPKKKGDGHEQKAALQKAVGKGTSPAPQRSEREVERSEREVERRAQARK